MKGLICVSLLAVGVVLGTSAWADPITGGYNQDYTGQYHARYAQRGEPSPNQMTVYWESQPFDGVPELVNVWDQSYFDG